MDYENILEDGRKQIIKINADTYKKLKVWKLKFEDGREAMLYKCGKEWLQRNEDDLDSFSLKAIGKFINNT